MNEAQFQLALQLVFNYSLDMVGWSAGIAALVAAFLVEPHKNSKVQLWQLRIIFLCCGTSILSGMILLSLIVGGVLTPDLIVENDSRKPNLAEVVPGFRQLAIVQFSAFLFGNGLVIWFAFDRTRSKT